MESGSAYRLFLKAFFTWDEWIPATGGGHSIRMPVSGLIEFPTVGILDKQVGLVHACNIGGYLSNLFRKGIPIVLCGQFKAKPVLVFQDPDRLLVGTVGACEQFDQ
ncbi:MAG: hypothetical protein ABI621_14680 [Chloroflexota bacterium]